MNRPVLVSALALCVAIGTGFEALASPRLIDKADYADRLEAFWLGQTIANWTGRVTEGDRQAAPFYTDADWQTGTGGQRIDLVLNQDPWRADDDTDIEYVYLHLLNLHETSRLTPGQIADGWIQHINRFIWVSNERARELMDAGLLPPETSTPSPANRFHLRIDAQLTTEFFGALAPCMPWVSLDLADLPIRTTATNHAAHASQYFVLLHALAPLVPDGLSDRDAVLWLNERARAYIPDESKAADIIDVVLADYLANPDRDDWERTRDLIYDRYQANASANGFRYQSWTESSVNFAAGVMTFLYGELDFVRTVRIGTLSGWDSDNHTATLGGLLGLMKGTQTLAAEIEAYAPGATLSNRYDVTVTRDNLPDLLPADPAAEDTFAMMAARCVEATERIVIEAGGRANDDFWLVPPPPPGSPLDANPVLWDHRRSANNAVRDSGGTVSTSIIGPNGPLNSGFQFVANGEAMLGDGREMLNNVFGQWTCQGAGLAPGDHVEFTVTYSHPFDVSAVRFIEGEVGATSGYFQSIVSLEVRDALGMWSPVQFVPSQGQVADRPFQIVDLELASAVTLTGIRFTASLGATPGAPEAYATLIELDALAARPAVSATGFEHFDRNANGLADLNDLYVQSRFPIDLDNDGDVDSADRAYLESLIRFDERADMGRRR